MVKFLNDFFSRSCLQFVTFLSYSYRVFSFVNVKWQESRVFLHLICDWTPLPPRTIVTRMDCLLERKKATYLVEFHENEKFKAYGNESVVTWVVLTIYRIQVTADVKLCLLDSLVYDALLWKSCTCCIQKLLFCLIIYGYLWAIEL